MATEEASKNVWETDLLHKYESQFAIDWRLGMKSPSSYVHPHGILPMMTLEEFSTAPEEHWHNIQLKFSDNRGCAIHRSKTPDWAYPICLLSDIRDEYFPVRVNFKSGQGVFCSDSNIYDGNLHSHTTVRPTSLLNPYLSCQFEEGRSALEAMAAWCGYATRLCNGDLFMWPLSRQSYISGVASNGKFFVEGDCLIEGSLPGALCIFPVASSAPIVK